jgi:hypothetical protein
MEKNITVGVPDTELAATETEGGVEAESSED